MERVMYQHHHNHPDSISICNRSIPVRQIHAERKKEKRKRSSALGKFVEKKCFKPTKQKWIWQLRNRPQVVNSWFSFCVKCYNRKLNQFFVIKFRLTVVIEMLFCTFSCRFFALLSQFFLSIIYYTYIVNGTLFYSIA